MPHNKGYLSNILVFIKKNYNLLSYENNCEYTIQLNATKYNFNIFVKIYYLNIKIGGLFRDAESY